MSSNWQKKVKIFLSEKDFSDHSGTDQQVLIEIGVENAHAFASLTGLDEEGLTLALDTSTGLDGLPFGYGSTGFYAFGNGYYAVSHDGHTDAGYHTHVRLYRLEDNRFVMMVDLICGWLVVLPLTYLTAFVLPIPEGIKLPVVFLCTRIDQCFKWIIAFIRLRGKKWIKQVTR